ncbi:cilia- and flagella-associated protein 36 [Anopheles maculipalpis]|uniref:cilia- and flagella-associated protein 36 n=1 Tax=Anopheles maculipalpis TaxID=1496333 RepID=UPI0021594EAB|nr:cilia- and flagella-associated protein 36 [Anopheles maculipalpis]
MADDNSWVFDSLVCFLHGPVWNAPLQTFIEDKSIIFDPNLQPDESNPEFRKVHDEYKNLVDYMLGSFMEEMQITPEQFEFACLEGRHVANLGGGATRNASAGTSREERTEQSGAASTFSFHQGLFQQIWAANDIRIFIRMMVQRNVELQLQALDLIERRSQSLSKRDAETEGPDHADDALPELELNIDRELKYPPEDQDIERDILRSVENELHTSVPDAEGVAPVLDRQSVLEQTLANGELTAGEKDKFQRLNLFFDQEKINNEDIKARQEYLRSQRDKILNIKKQARARQLNETIRKNDRPTSAQVAQKFLDGETESVSVEPPEGSLQLRKLLAQRLRNEVAIDKE